MAMACMKSRRTVWEANLPAYEANPPLLNDTSADVVIVGGGFSGLSTAWHIKKADASASVIIIEAREIGYGASGRAAGNCFSLFGESIATVRKLHGKQKTIDAHHYLKTALRYLAYLVEHEEMSSDYQPRGFLRVATSERLGKCLEATYAIYQDLGIDADFEWLSLARVRENFPSSPFRTGLVDNDCALLNPLKHVREWKRLCEQEGVKIFESTPFLGFERSNPLSILTPHAKICSDRLVLGTNAYSHLLSGVRKLRGIQSPVWTHMIATEPLGPERRQAIGWKGGEGIYDCLHRPYYCRISADGRVCFGGGTPAVTIAYELDDRISRDIWTDLETRLVQYFPPLKGIKIEHRWKGPVSVCVDMVPTIGFLGDERVLVSCGFVGHGIPITQLNGKTAAQLICGQSSELTEFWAVNRRVFPWPSSPLDYWLKRGIIAAMKIWDSWNQAR